MRNIEDIYPLSAIQQGLLFHSLYAPKGGTYFIQVGCTLQGNLNVIAFEQAWQEIIDRHPILRTSFVWDALDEPLQLVHRHARLPREQQNWCGLSQEKQEEQLEAFLKSDRSHGFDLTKAPLMRLAIFQVTEDTYQFTWSCHHLLVDGWCIPFILQEVMTFYEAACQGEHLQLKQRRPYRDYIAWLKRQDLSAAELYWRQALKGFAEPTSIEVGEARKNLPSQRQGHAQQEIRLSVTMTAALQSLALQHQLTLNTLVQGAWALLLSHYSSKEEIVFGVTAAGRPATLTGAEFMVGPFINTLPVRVRVSPNALLLPWLRELQTQQVDAREYEYSPLVQIQGWSEVPRNSPLFETILVFENYPVDAELRKLARELRIHNVRILDQTNYPLTVVAVPSSEFSLRILYDCCRFDTGEIVRMLRHFQNLLEGMVANPEQHLLALTLLTEAEQHQLLVEWNNDKTEYPREQCLHELFEAEAKRNPDSIAVVFNDEQLTYGELNQQANWLAYRLQNLGVEPEVLVGICLERSLEMVIGLLGILKAGGSYVPLDPKYPKARLDFLIEDAQISVLVTQQKLVQKLPEHRAKLICLDWATIPHLFERNPVSGVTSENLACIYYTSGSTGEPKGVPVCHRSIIRTFFGVNYIQFDRKQKFLQLSPISWDGLTLELWGALLHGAQCILFPEGTPDLRDLGYTIRNYGISTLWLTASLFNAVIDEFPEALLNVQQLMTGGEMLSLTHVYRALSHLPLTQIINGYGPAESTVFACCYSIPSQLDRNIRLMPIGRPISNTQVYLLDHYLQPVPVGVAGELHIGGDGLARGYLNRPDLTAEKFIPNPFSDERGARLYKTGDLARYRLDGNIEFLGRLDHQVKIRGFRIELSEIESVLCQHPSVQMVAVLAREDEPGNKRLVAYLVSKEQPKPTITELRSFLRQKLSDYMLPSAFIILDSLPLTPNGKVDYRALPVPNQTRPELEEVFETPRNSVEVQLAKIFTQVLDLEQIGIHDNFFELGGHSLLATQVISRARATFQVELSISSLFESPTIADLAIVITKNIDEQANSERVAQMMKELEQISEEEAMALFIEEVKLTENESSK